MKRAQILTSAAALLAILNTGSANTQGLENPDTIEAIVGTPVHEEEVQAAADPQKVIAAIENSAESVSAVRKTSNLANVDIVFLADAAVTEGGPPAEIEEKLAEHQADITLLRQEIEGNAMLFHALNSRRILVRDVVAVEFEDQSAVIYAAAKPPAPQP